MKKFKLTKSTYCEGVQCAKILWLNNNKPEVREETDIESILETGKEVGEAAKGLFPEIKTIDLSEGIAQMLIRTTEYIEDGVEYIAEASFTYKNNFCSVDILRNNKGSLEIYEVKSSTELKDIYLDDVAYQYYVLKNNGYQIKSVNIMYINNEYIRDGELDLNKLFITEDVTVYAMEKQEEVKENIERIKECLEEDEEPKKDIGLYCSNPYDCSYWGYCSRHLPNNNVFNIAWLTKKKKFKLYYDGMYSFEDLRFSDINPKQMEQVIFELDNLPPKIEHEEIQSFLRELYFPLYFLDFETYQQAIPLYDGINPYMQIPFQYSIHYLENENCELKHLDFLGATGVDSREGLAKKLIEDIPSNACILAYNMSFEKGVINRLAECYPHFSNELMNIHNNIKDLMLPFQNRDYYAKELAGSYSIKKVLPTLFPNDSELNYDLLPGVKNGTEAMNIFKNLASKSKEEQKSIRHGLREYCKLDTLAMVKIWEKLKELSKK